MSKKKLKIEGCNSWNDLFFSFNKTGVMKRYLNQSENILPDFSYILISHDKIKDIHNIKIDNEYMILNEIYVAPKNRNCGLGKELMIHVIEYLKNHKPSNNFSIILEADSKWANSDIKRLKNFYISFGFVEIDENLFELKL